MQSLAPSGQKLAVVKGKYLPAKELGEREVVEAVSRSVRFSLRWLLSSLSGIFRAASLHCSSPFESMLICKVRP